MLFGTLIITLADGRTRNVPLDRATLRVGRNADNDIVIDDASISGYHARLFAGPGGVSILDIGSRNGTEVDGQLIDTLAPLGPASTVRLGSATLRVSPPGGAAPPMGAADDFALPPFPDPPAPATLAAAASAAATAPAISAAPAEGPPLVRLSLQPEALVADLGAGLNPAVLSLTATVQNLSRFVDRIDLAVEAPPWVTVVLDPPQHALLPGQSGQSRIELSVPRLPAALAGEHSVELVGRSQKRADLRFAVPAALNVTPFTEFRVDLLEPRARTAWTGGRYKLEVVNLSNRVLPFTLEGQNDDSALNFRFEPEPVQVIPGGRSQSEVRARFKLLRLFGQPKTYNFNLVAEPFDESAPPQMASGRLIQRPPLPPWALITAAVLSLLALVSLCFTLAFRERGRIAGLFGSLWNIPTATLVAATVDPLTTINALNIANQQTQAAVNSALAQTGEAAQGANQETQQAVQSAAVATQGALGTSASGTQTAAASSVSGTQTVQATQVVASQVAAGTQFAGTATAQANATGTALAGTQTVLAQTPSAGPLTPTTPTVAGPPSITPTLPAGPLAGQTIVFSRVGALPVAVRLPVRGDEYNRQDAFFCFYQPQRNSVGASFGGANFSLAMAPVQQPPLGLSIGDVRLAEGNNGATNFVFTVNWRVAPPVVIRSLAFAPPQQGGTVTVDFNTADGGAGAQAATAPADYLPVSGTAFLSLPAGSQVATTTITVAVTGDVDFEADEAFTLRLFNPSGGVTIADGEGVGVIVNDDLASPTPSFTATPSATSSPTNTAVVSSPTPTSTALPEPNPPPAGDVFDCRPPTPAGQSLLLLRGVIYPPPVRAANNAPEHSLTTDAGENTLVGRAIGVINFQRNVSDVNVDIWYPGGEAATYVMFALDERGALVGTAQRDAIGVPARYQLNVRSLERPIRQIIIEARRSFGGEFNERYSFDPVVPPLLTRVEFRYTNP